VGRASVTTTIDRYGQLMPNVDGRLAAPLDGAFSGEVVALRLGGVSGADFAATHTYSVCMVWR
jgi:hypothetical protein